MIGLSALHLFLPVFMRGHLDQLQDSFAEDMYGITLKQCKVTWGGLLNPLGAELKNVVLSNPWSKSIQLSADTIRVSLKTRALIRGKIDLGRIKIRGARIRHTHFAVAEGDFDLQDRANGMRVRGQLQRLNLSQLSILANGDFNAITKGEPLLMKANFDCYVMKDLNIKSFSGHIEQLGNGAIYHSKLYPVPMEVQQLQANLHGDCKTLHINDLSFNRANSSGAGKITLIASNCWRDLAKTDGQVAVQLAIDTKNVPFNELPITWPQGLAPTPRSWVISHIKAGYSPKSHFALKGHFELGEESKFCVDDVDGTIEACDAVVSYYGDLPAVQGVKAKISYNKTQFLIQLLDGHINRLKLTKGLLNLHKLDSKASHINIALKLQGPASDTLDVIAHKPLRLPQKLNIDHQKIGGEAVTDLHLSFPLRTSNTLDDVNVAASAKISGAKMPLVKVGDRHVELTKGRLKLSVTKDKMNMVGQANLDGTPSDIAWEQWFSDDKAPFRRQYKLRAELSASVLQKLGVPWCDKLSGAAMANCIFTVQDKNKAAEVELRADLSGMQIDYPIIALKKQVAQPGSISFKGKLDLDKTNNSFVLHRLMAKMDGLNVKIVKQGNKLIGQDISLGNNKFDIEIILGPDKPTIKLRSNYLNADKLKQFISEDGTGSKQSMDIWFNVDKLDFEKYGALTELKGMIGINNSRLTSASLNYRALDSDRKSKIYTNNDAKSRHLQLNLKLKDSAWLLSFFHPGLGIVEGDMAGRVMLAYGKNDELECAGNLYFHHVVFANAPVMMRFLTFCSPGGLKGIITGSGAHFADGEVKFRSSPREMVFRKLLFTGPSLAVRAHGRVDRVARKLDFSAEATPLYILNAAIANIPLIGKAISGGSKDGVFVTPVVVTGDFDNPKITTKKAMTFVPRGLISKRAVLR